MAAHSVPSPAPRAWLVLVAGPYLSGTGGDPDRIAANRRALEAAALPLWDRGHLAVIGEWFALPIIEAAGGRAPGDAVWQKLQYPVAHRLLERCDAVLRLSGESKGADADVARARALGLPVFTSIDEIPRVATSSSAGLGLSLPRTLSG